MGSIIDYVECPNCGLEMFSDFYYKSGEEYAHCSNCGYHHSAQIVNRNKPLNRLTDEDWKFTTINNPYGAYKLQFSDEKGATCGSMRTEEEWNTFKNNVLGSEANNLISYFSLSRYVDGVFKVLSFNGVDFEEVIKQPKDQRDSQY